MMLRHAIAAAVILMSLAPPSTAAVTISASASPTQGLPGYNTWLLRAHSDAPMQGFDFAGDKSNDPATGRGFFGPMNQINPFAHPTIFSDNNIVIDVIVGSSSWDSQFLVNTRDIVVPAFFAEEGPNILQAVWAHPNPVGTEFALARIVVPNGGAFSYRGLISVVENDSIVEVPVEGRFPIPEPASIFLAGCAIFVAGSVRRRDRIRLQY